MFGFLKNHPFAVEAFFESSLVFTYAVHKDELTNLIPPCLQLDTFNNEWAFIAVALVQTKQLRPKGFPKILGNNFFLIGYRIFVRYVTPEGKRLRGLYILKSETDSKKMQLLGSLFTHYNYTTTDITISETQVGKKLQSVKSNFAVQLENTEAEFSTPAGSPFSNWKDARRFAGPLPFTFTYNAKNKSVLIIEGQRENWTPTPVKVSSCNFGFINAMKLKTAVLANAFEIKNVPYHWKKGVTQPWP